MKEEVSTMDVAPSKRVYKSIIADYSLNQAICELVDNSYDTWKLRKHDFPLEIRILLNFPQQTLSIEDNAGGIEEKSLPNIISPGSSSLSGQDDLIGIFGVGSKRAVVAIAQDIRITSRHGNDATFQVEYGDEWLADEGDWNLAYYRVDDIESGTTRIFLRQLRFELQDVDKEALEEHLSATYGKLLEDKRIQISINDQPIIGKSFEKWSFPPEYPPSKTEPTQIEVGDLRPVEFTAIAGLIHGKGSISGEYGVYIYCNNRLISRALKNLEVGFKRPHHSLSIVRVIIFLNGPSEAMPWNSSKSGVNYQHPVFLALRTWLHSNVKYYCDVSRRLVKDWDEEVFTHDEGSPIEYPIEKLDKVPTYFRSPLPKVRPSYRSQVDELNKEIVAKYPWTKGLYEGLVAVDLLFKDKKMEQKNRICLILLDSTLEIAFKDFMLNHPDDPIGSRKFAKDFGKREDVTNEIKKRDAVPEELWPKIKHFYELRCQLIHQKSTARITDEEIRGFRYTVQICLQKMFGIRWPQS